MLIEVHYGNGSILLINGNCRSINFVNYLRKHCCVSLTIPIDLCSLNTGEPFHLLSSQTKIVSADQRRLPAHLHCVLTRIEEDGTYIPLLNDPTLITNEFLAKLKRATSTSVKPIPTKTNTKSTKQQKLQIEKPKRRRSLKSVAIVATIVNSLKH
ncbi:unnamed protein product [Adineta ricciae]|uniref:Uncharacterized protein n=1 Tax=Adineta ricciae TaxID=249248 RepID=A0A815SHR2_ADIRI|nr:unnamed protein product [Adineta ricciae]CAF1630391.1 unnamed protein product [Adineta ricciae]